MTMMGNSIPVHEYYRIMNEFNANCELLAKVQEVNEKLKKEVEALKAELELAKAATSPAVAEKPKKVIQKFTLDDEGEE